MKISELIVELSKLPQDFEVTSYEGECNDFIPVIEVGIHETELSVRLMTAYDKEHG